MKQVLTKISNRVANFVKGMLLITALPFLVFILVCMVLLFGRINISDGKFDTLVFDARL